MTKKVKGPIPDDEIGKPLFKQRCPGCNKDTEFEMVYYVTGTQNICRGCGWRSGMDPTVKQEVVGILLKLDISCPIVSS